MILPAMKNPTVADDDPDLHQLQVEEQRLRERLDEVEKGRSQLATAKHESAYTLPPSELVQSYGAQQEHEGRATRAQGRNLRRDEGRSILLLLVLAAALLAVVWWIVRLVQGG